MPCCKRTGSRWGWGGRCRLLTPCLVVQAGISGPVCNASPRWCTHLTLHPALLLLAMPTPPSLLPPLQLQLIDHNAALAERVDSLGGGLERAESSAQRWEADAAAAQQVRAHDGLLVWREARQS